MGKIGLGITTRNRRDVFEYNYARWIENTGKDVKIVVVDDASDDPLLIADKRFEEQQGIARAKNACLALLDDCEHIFLADDDISPKRPHWEELYILSGYKHMCFSFEKNIKGERLSHSVFRKETFVNDRGMGFVEYNAPNGCLLYVKREVLDVVGGLDPEFGLWGYEHVEWSERIYAAGLTERKFVDSIESFDFIYSGDCYGEVNSSVPEKTRVEHAGVNKMYYEKVKDIVRYIPYK